jgi:hypothetical protein
MSLVAAPNVPAARLAKSCSWWARILSAIAQFFGSAAVANDLTIIPVLARSLAHPRRYQEILWTAEQVESRAVLIDLTQVRRVDAALFEALAIGWSSQRVEKVGARVSFEQWARLYRGIAPHQRCLERKGVRFMLFYDAQDFGAWYRHDRVVHDPEAVIQRLGVVSELSMRWPALLDAAASLLDGYGAHARAEALVKLSQLALNCGVDRKALDFAHDALCHENALPAKLECRARRIMGEALLHLDQYEHGIRCIENAI